MTPDVFCLTWCQDINQLYGSTLLFKTWRVGFPNARLVVVENASLPEARAEVRRLARDVGASFIQLEQEIRHEDFLQRHVDSAPGGNAIAFVDPDVCFWESVEGTESGGLVSGRLIPRFWDPYTQCLTEPRLHTSLLNVPNVGALRAEISRLQEVYIHFDPFRPIMFRDGETWRRFDSGGTLYAALGPGAAPFDDVTLARYDHLFCGSHLPRVLPSFSPEMATQWREMHLAVQVDHRALKGAHVFQQAAFEKMAV